MSLSCLSPIFLLTICLVPGLGSFLPSNDQWTTFKQEYAKNYFSTEQEQKSKSTWADNSFKILAHNVQAAMGAHRYRLAINQFADIERETFKKTVLGGFLGSALNNKDISSLGIDPPNASQTVNWVERGKVTPVKNQGICGACWAFAAAASLESAHAIKTNQLVSFSEQNLIDCSWSYGNMGCIGGLMVYAFDYVIDNGIDTEASYPYTATGSWGSCAFDPLAVGGTENAYYSVPQGSEDWLQVVVEQQGPVACGINANSFQFMFYSSGIFSIPDCSSGLLSLDHAITVVGFGTSAEGTDYWLIKNSWGTAWGMDGYMMLERNANNMCGIATYCQFPVV